ncbi:MAG: CDP-glycerol--glycerophosphate glycerophosphotransferase [Shewanella sp.]
MYIAQNYSYAILRPLQQEIIAQGGEVRWFLEGDEVNPSLLKPSETRLLTVDDVTQWQPDAVFVPGNTVPNFIPGVKVGVFHGFNAGKINRRGREDHFEIRGCFDLYCTQGHDTTSVFNRLSDEYGFFKVTQTGWPALDPLFTPVTKNPYVDNDDTRKTVLMCSTFSRNLTCAPHLYNEIKILSESGKWRWLIQFHPKMPIEVVEMYKELQGPNLTFVETDNVIPLLQAADVMLCDTSSILIMFLLQQKPVVTFKNLNPQPHLMNIEDSQEIESALTHALEQPTDLMNEITKYSQIIHPYKDGQSSARVLAAANELISSGLGSLSSKPLNLIRELKMRTKLNYWKW